MKRNTKISVCIFYQTDPLATVPGGIDTFIRGILGYAPDNICMSVVGYTTHPDLRPVGKWQECVIRNNNFQFLPLFPVKNQGKQRKLPLSVELTARLATTKNRDDIDVLEFHRIEPSIPFFFDKRPKNLVIHQNMSSIKDSQSDIRWKSLPWLYFKIEDLLLRKFGSVFSVREDAVSDYKTRFPSMASKFKFIPTWMDPEIFSPVEPVTRWDLRTKFAKEFGFSTNDCILISVGRLDHQKDPMMMLDAFKRVHNKRKDLRLVWVGDGVLKETVGKQICLLGLEGLVVFAGLRSPTEVAELLNASDLFILSSAYEGMPMCVLEALGCGLPVVTTDVGEVKKVIQSGLNGEIVTNRNASMISSAVLACLANLKKYKGEPCTKAVINYTPQKVLEPYYENYRILASSNT